MLDGWSKECGHNFVSGLIWGPDGWLYGRHGIVDTSYPGVPGTPQSETPSNELRRLALPSSKAVGRSCLLRNNQPLGLGLQRRRSVLHDEQCAGAFVACVAGRAHQADVWSDFNPHLYELMDMTADHYHWDTTKKWNESRDGVANDLGGGHSHVGGLIYQGTISRLSIVARSLCVTHMVASECESPRAFGQRFCWQA